MIFMVGNKQDLESEREVSRESAMQFQRDNNIKYWTETSAKQGHNIESLFLDASKFLFKQL
jgi:GTPase SAR1 family protein